MLRIIIVAAGTVAVTVAEKAPHVVHAHDSTRIIVGLVFGLPFLIAVLLLTRHAGKAAAAAGAVQRPSYTFNSPPARRR